MVVSEEVGRGASACWSSILPGFVAISLAHVGIKACIMFLHDLVFLKWYLLHARLNSHNEAWSYRKRKRLRANKKAVLTESKDERCQKILHAKNLEFSCVRKETVDIDILITSRDGDGKIMQSIRITNGTPSENKEVEQFSKFR